MLHAFFEGLINILIDWYWLYACVVSVGCYDCWSQPRRCVKVNVLRVLGCVYVNYCQKVRGVEEGCSATGHCRRPNTKNWVAYLTWDFHGFRQDTRVWKNLMTSAYLQHHLLHWRLAVFSPRVCTSFRQACSYFTTWTRWNAISMVHAGNGVLAGDSWGG